MNNEFKRCNKCNELIECKLIDILNGTTKEESIKPVNYKSSIAGYCAECYKVVK